MNQVTRGDGSAPFRKPRSLLVALAVACLVAILAVSAECWHAERAMRAQAGEVFSADDLTADVLPPPLSLIEARLVLAMALDGSLKPAQASKRFDLLEAAYRERMAAWHKTPPPAPLVSLLARQHDAAIAFMNSARAYVLEPLAIDDLANASAALPRVEALYEAHRAAVDETARASRAIAAARRGEFEATATATGWLMAVLLAAALLPMCLLFAAIRRPGTTHGDSSPRADFHGRAPQPSASTGSPAEAAGRIDAGFLRHMSGDVRASMNCVLGLVRLLLRTPLGPLQADYLDMVRSSATRLLRSVDDTLDFAKADGGRVTLEVADFDLDETIERVAQAVASAAAEKGLELVLERGTSVPARVRGDARRLEQVLGHLVGNAVKFTAVGEVAIGVDLVGDDGNFVELRFTVRDTGIGLTDELRGKMFEPFGAGHASAASRLGGSGIGLTVCRRLIVCMGGEISVQSGVGAGSTFSFNVTLERVAQARPDALPFPASLIGTHALVVDDNKTSMNAIARMLRSFGMSVTAMTDGAAAIDEAVRANSAGQPYRLVIVDWQMPRMNGFAVIAELDRAGRADGAAFIMATAHERALLDGDLEIEKLDGLIVKPVTASALLAAVAGVLAQGDRATRGMATADGGRPPRVRSGTRLLVVEDDPVHQIVVREVLRGMGAKAEIASSGALALERLRQGETFDAVLMDVQMPGLDGLQTTRAIRAMPACGRLPIIALTAHARDEDRLRCLDAGMNDCLAKPIDDAAIAACLARWIPGKRSAESTAAVDTRLPVLRRLEELATQIPGFSAAAAVSCMNGNAESLVDLLALFVETSDDVSRRLRVQLRLGETHAALQTLHALRGASSSIALDSIAHACAELERALRDSTDARVLTERCDRLCWLLDVVITRLRAWGNRAHS